MSPDKSQRTMAVAHDIVVNSLLILMKSYPEVTYAGYDNSRRMFLIKTSEWSHSFTLVFQEEIRPGDAGHA